MVGQIINNESIVTRGRNIVSKNVISQGGAVVINQGGIELVSKLAGKEYEKITH